MTDFIVERYGADDWRLIRYDGSETEVATWTSEPALRDAANALMDHHGTGNQPFSSRKGTLDSLELANQWPLPTRDMTVSGETVPWNDS